MCEFQEPLSHWGGSVGRNIFAAAAKSLQLCPTLSDPMDCSPPGSSILGIFQAGVLEWGAIAFSKYSQNPTICSSCTHTHK